MWNRGFFDLYESHLAKAKLGGGEERLRKLRRAGKLTARERLELLFDANTFHEIGMFVESRAVELGMEKKHFPGDGVVTGYGMVDGCLVFASSQDFTVCGGSGGEEHLNKICRIHDMAVAARAPFVSINESGGARIEEGICALDGYSKLFYRNTQASGVIPQIAVILGNCAGGASYSPALCDFIFMLRGKSQMYITGPQVIKAVTGKMVGMEELGGAHVHAQESGQAHFIYDNEENCLAGTRTLLKFLLKSQVDEISRPPDPEVHKIQDIVPEDQRRAYNVRNIIETIVDANSFFEVSSEFAKNIVVGFVRIQGRSVGLIANQPNFLGGALECNAADKAARFIRFCDCFNIPLLTLVDVPGFLPGLDQEHRGILRHGSKLLYAYSEATVPKITLIMRKAYGGAYCAMCGKGLGADIVYAWPIAEIAVMGAEGAVNVVYRKRLNESSQPDQERKNLIDDYERQFLNPYYAAQRGFIDEVIRPEETRSKIEAALQCLENKSQNPLIKKHGNIPL
ncbi:MAG: acyl-CoA carboxylase subunit beta [Planctomycetia bacterium]|nr:acyl-CoA carboxylase subunit beta [Planctomycetia bacterium]